MIDSLAKELFSIQIDPPRNAKKARGVVYGVYENGVMTVLETEPYSQDNLYASGHIFKLLSDEDIVDFTRFAKEWDTKLKDCPFDLNLPNYQGAQFHLSLGGKLISGSYYLADLEKASLDKKVPKLALKIMEWDNRIVGMIQSFLQEHVRNIKGKLQPLPKDTAYLDCLRPVSRYLLFLDRTDSGGFFLSAKTKEEAIKAAAKKLFSGREYPPGDVFSLCFDCLAAKALPMLEKTKSCEDFDVSHSALTREIVSLSQGTLSYASAAYWLDLSFTYFLLTDDLIRSETKASFLHVPMDAALLFQENPTTSEEDYLFFEKAGRKEWAPLRIAPIYFYLESIFVDAHPEPNKSAPHLA